MFDGGAKREIVTKMVKITEDLLNDYAEPLRFVLLSFVNDCLIELKTGKNWFDGFTSESRINGNG